MLAQLSPPLFRLEDLMQHSVPGFFYAEQLTVTQKPKDSDFFLVERVLKTKTIKKKKYYFCKFLFYPGFPRCVKLVGISSVR